MDKLLRQGIRYLHLAELVSIANALHLIYLVAIFLIILYPHVKTSHAEVLLVGLHHLRL